MFDTSVHLKLYNTTSVAWISKQTAPIETEFSTVKNFLNFAAQRKLEIMPPILGQKRIR